MTSFLDKQKITGVVLSGGLSRRMGGQEKALINFKGKAMIAHVVERLKPQVATVIINTNRQIERYKQFGYPIISDQFGHFDGPLAGVYSALLESKTTYLLVVPCDSPLITHSLVERLYAEMIQADSQAAVAHDGDRLQPVFALISTTLTTSLKQYLESGQRKLDRWFKENNATIVDFSDSKEMFYNINTAEELKALEDKD